jgi:uncharacterized protein YidB (DUF937 family)
MSNDLLGQILGSVLGNAAGNQRDLPGGLGGPGGGLGGVLGSVFGRGSDQAEIGKGSSPIGGKGALVAMLLPLAMRWVQQNGGIGAVLDRFKQQGYSRQAASWVSTGENQPVDAQAVSEVVGTEELSRLSQQLGVPHDQVASGLADILPEVVDHLTPAGDVPQDADDVLGSGLAALERLLGGQRGAGL